MEKYVDSAKQFGDISKIFSWFQNHRPPCQLKYVPKNISLKGIRSPGSKK